MLANGKQLITHSRQACFKECRRKHYYAYQVGLRRTDDGKALRMGSAFHSGVESLGKSSGIDAACAAVRVHYENMPDAFDTYDWAIECETVLRLVLGYEWRWRTMPLENIAPEKPFQLPLVNPETNRPTPIFDEAGKIDGIVRLEDGRLAIKETKTVSEDVSLNSDFWRRLRMDSQISLYIEAARRLGFDVSAVLYDVVRKPSISPTAVPLTDMNGLKIVLDSDDRRVMNKNGVPRQTGDNEKGYVLQTRPMEISEWGEKLTNDICERPDFYFARVEIARLDQDIEEFRRELWDVQQMIRDAQKEDRHYRTVNRNTCQYCPYFDICCTNQQLDRANPPIGFEFASDLHPELERSIDDNASTSTPDAAETCATAAESIA